MKPGTGWRPWIDAPWAIESAYTYARVELMRDEWEKPIAANPAKLPPEMNVADLWWRPAPDQQ